jgi:ammonium transporter, Amt family
LGWALAYGPNSGPFSGFFGYSQFFGIGLVNFARFFFQYVFAARASTIISGAVAERAEFTTFFAYSLLVPGKKMPF